MNTRFIEWIWHIRGSLPLAPGQSGDEAFDRLDPLFHKAGTSHHRSHDRLTFSKKDQAAQDRMSIFDGGELRIEKGASGPVLHYNLTSRALLFCFLAPLLFLAFAQLTMALGKLEKTPAQVEKAPDGAADKKAEVPMNPIDKFLGAPPPEKKDKAKDKANEKEREDKKHSPTPAYVFAGIFAALYLIGRILEDRLIKGLFARSLQPSPAA